MYGVEVNAKHANYYLPVQHGDDGEIPACKKRRESVPTPPSHATRILGRKYALTTTTYKYLEIGISVGLVPAVEIVLGDNRGNQLILPTETWRQLMEKRVDIQRLLQEDKPSSSSSSPLWIGDLAVEFCKMNDSKIVKLSLTKNSLYLKPATMDTLFTFEYCIDHMYVWLSENTHMVNLKFRNFVNVLREKNITEIKQAAKAIRESINFDCESLIDCELLASALKEIMYEVYVNK